MNGRNAVPLAVLALFLATALAGCLEGDEGTAAETSLTEIRVADMPTEDFLHVNVSFTEVKLHSDEAGWESIYADRTVDLLYLHENNLSERLGVENITAANYTKLWLVVDNATGVLADTGETVYFDVPSGTLKIQHLFALQEGNNSITLDIDLDRSIFARGDMYKLLPVISGLNVSYANGTQVHIRDRDRIQNMTRNRPPVVDIVANGTRGRHLTAAVNESITFDAGGSFDVDNDSLTFAWDFDDGTSATGSTVEHTFNETGAYQVILTVSDGENASTGHLTVTVRGQGGNGRGP
ncbi:MAG: PKD domain-containing protein [Thermoplasmatota archaeon]